MLSAWLAIAVRMNPDNDTMTTCRRVAAHCFSRRLAADIVSALGTWSAGSMSFDAPEASGMSPRISGH